MKTILTGSSGFIASYLKKLLPEDTLLIDKKSSFCAIDILGLYAEEERVFYGDEQICDNRFEVELIYHLAGQTDVQKSIETPIQDAVDNILTMIKMVTLFPNARIIYTETSAIQYEGDKPIMKSPYALSKYTAEQYLHLLGTNYIVVVLPNVYGEGGRCVVDVFKAMKKVRVNGDGSQTRNFIYVGDVARQLVELSKSDKVKVFLEGEYFSVKQIAEMTGKPIEYVDKLQGEVEQTEPKINTYNGNVKVEEFLLDKHKK